MRSAAAFLTLAAVLFVSANETAAQNLTVQQPVFRRFSVGTTVSVPDRGRLLLGGVSRAGASRRCYGPPRSGSSFGQFREHAGVSAHVTVHDLGEMDRRLLEQAEQGTTSVYRRGDNSAASRAYDALLGRHRSRQASRRTERFGRNAASSAESQSAASTGPVERAARSFRLGQEAEAEGKAAVARLHYRMAARHGSARARERLDALGERGTSARIAGSR